MSTLKVTNIKAADGTSALSIADSSGNVTVGTGKVFAPNGIVFSSTELTEDDASTTTRTESSNLLDDYEEGSFSGVVKIGTTTNTPAVTPYFKYTKIGNVVHIWGEVYQIAKSGSSGNLLVTGLPFASVSGEMYFNVQVRWAGITTNEGNLIGVIAPGDDEISFQDVNANGYAGTIDYADVSSTYHLYSFNAYYRTA